MHTVLFECFCDYGCKDSANRAKYKINWDLFLFSRCSLSYSKIVQIGQNTK